MSPDDYSGTDTACSEDYSGNIIDLSNDACLVKMVEDCLQQRSDYMFNYNESFVQASIKNLIPGINSKAVKPFLPISQARGNR